VVVLGSVFGAGPSGLAIVRQPGFVQIEFAVDWPNGLGWDLTSPAKVSRVAALDGDQQRMNSHHRLGNPVNLDHPTVLSDGCHPPWARQLSSAS